MRRLGLAIALIVPAAGFVFGTQEPSFDDVEHIIARSCTPCHSPSGPAPFTLRTYEEVKRRGERIGINVASMAMPPCQIESDFGSFSSIPGLTTEEVVLIRRWATTGMAPPKIYPQLPPPQPFSWRLGKPQVTVRSGEISAPAEGGIHWVFAKVRVPRSGVVRGLQVKPTDVQTVRQALVGVAQAGVPVPKTGQTTLPHEAELIGAWAFGYYVWRAPLLSGVYVQEGDELHVMLQCQAIGKPGDASFEIGLYYGGKAHVPTEQLVMEKADFTIAVGEKPTYKVEHVLEQDIAITALFPEFRYACERVSLTATLPSGETKTLFKGRWDVYWTGAYNFIAPAQLPKGTKLLLEAAYNNGFEATHGPAVRAPIERGTGLEDELCRMTVQYLPH